VLAEHVLGHAGVVERHVVIRPVIDHQLHDRTGRSIVAAVGHRVADFEHDARSRGARALRQGVDHATRVVDTAGERVARGEVSLAVDRRRRRDVANHDLRLDRIAVGTHPPEPDRALRGAGLHNRRLTRGRRTCRRRRRVGRPPHHVRDQHGADGDVTPTGDSQCAVHGGWDEGEEGRPEGGLPYHIRTTHTAKLTHAARPV
jgi:hypothetical protein